MSRARMDDAWLPGGCHCGAVRFRVRPRTLEALACNCSICKMKGFVNVIVPEEDFELVDGEAMLGTYTFNTHQAQHRFCTRCGIHPFSRPRSHPDGYDVNARCLDGDAMDRFTVTEFDGRNWEESVAKIQ